MVFPVHKVKFKKFVVKFCEIQVKRGVDYLDFTDYVIFHGLCYFSWIMLFFIFLKDIMEENAVCKNVTEGQSLYTQHQKTRNH